VHSSGSAGGIGIPCAQICKAAAAGDGDMGWPLGAGHLAAPPVGFCCVVLSPSVEMRSRSRTHHHRKSWWGFLLSLVVSLGDGSDIFGFLGRWSRVESKHKNK